MNRAAVLGVNGQDGSYLAEHLLKRGYAVLGIGRQANSRYVPCQAGFEYLALDLRECVGLARSLEAFSPDFVFHVAAVHGPSGFLYETIWRDALAVHVGALHAVLEYGRIAAPGLKTIFASSSKVFGSTLPRRVTEKSNTFSSCLYSATKNAARDLVSLYRSRHDMQASILYLFNHESVRRPDGYFIPRIAKVLAAAIAGRSPAESFQTLDFLCDWGSAREYMDIAVDIAERTCGEDYIVATGRTWHGREFADAVFSRHNLDYRRYISEQKSEDSELRPFSASTAKLARELGRTPQVSILEICDELAEHYRGSAVSRDRLDFDSQSRTQ